MTIAGLLLFKCWWWRRHRKYFPHLDFFIGGWRRRCATIVGEILAEVHYFWFHQHNNEQLVRFRYLAGLNGAVRPYKRKFICSGFELSNKVPKLAVSRAPRTRCSILHLNCVNRALTGAVFFKGNHFLIVGP